MKTFWQLTVIATVITALLLEACCLPSEHASQREKRQAMEDRQFIGGLSTLGALIQPILFMIGMANLMGRIPSYFTRSGVFTWMRDRFSSTLAGTGAPAGAGRKKRSLGDTTLDEHSFQRAIEILRVLADAQEEEDRERRG